MLNSHLPVSCIKLIFAKDLLELKDLKKKVYTQMWNGKSEKE